MDFVLIIAYKIKKSESGSKQPTQLIVELNSSLRHIIVHLGISLLALTGHGCNVGVGQVILGTVATADLVDLENKFT